LQLAIAKLVTEEELPTDKKETSARNQTHVSAADPE
jgi:hypothetical protein